MLKLKSSILLRKWRGGQDGRGRLDVTTVADDNSSHGPASDGGENDERNDGGRATDMGTTVGI